MKCMQVLRAKFPGTLLVPDVCTLQSLPKVREGGGRGQNAGQQGIAKTGGHRKGKDGMGRSAAAVATRSTRPHQTHTPHPWGQAVRCTALRALQPHTGPRCGLPIGFLSHLPCYLNVTTNVHACCPAWQETELLAAGFPCIDVSRAGLRKGLAGQVRDKLGHTGQEGVCLRVWGGGQRGLCRARGCVLHGLGWNGQNERVRG